MAPSSMLFKFKLLSKQEQKRDSIPSTFSLSILRLDSHKVLVMHSVNETCKFKASIKPMA